MEQAADGTRVWWPEANLPEVYEPWWPEHPYVGQDENLNSPKGQD